MKIHSTFLIKSIFFLILTNVFFNLDSKAQIIYTDLIPDSIANTSGEIYQLDLNNDGIFDFILTNTTSTVTSTICTFPTNKTRHGVTINSVNSQLDYVANSSYAGVDYVAPIGMDTIIDDSSNIWLNTVNQNLVNVNWNCQGNKSHHVWHTTVTGKWNGATDKYLGLKITVGGNTYFGWVRLTIGTSSFTVKDYAYNSAPDQLIFSGQSSNEYLISSPISGSPFCAGGNLNIPFIVYGNFDSTNVFTAQLSDSAGSFTNPVAIGTLQGNVSGIFNSTIPPGTLYGLLYRIRVVASNPVCVSNANNANLIVNTTLPLNLITSIDSTRMCAGDSARLLAPTQTGNSFQWSLDNTNIPNATFYFYYGKSEGTYRCMISNGCGSLISDSIELKLDSLPPVVITTSGPLWICPGQSVTFYANTSPNFSYIWYQNGGVVGTQPSYTASQSAVYNVIITDNNGCSNSSSLDTVLRSIPYVNIVAGGQLSFCLGDSVFLRQTSITDTSFTFQWLLNGNNIPGATENYFYAKLTGAYQIVITNPYGNCRATSNFINAVAGCTGTEKINSPTHFSISPNPAAYFLEVKRYSEKPANIQIIDHLGQVVYFEKINSHQKIINVSNLSEGVYFIKWNEDDYSESKQFSIAN